MGGFGVGGGLVGSGFLAGLGAAGLEAGAAAAVGVGVEGGGGVDLVVECSVKSPVEAVEDVGADLLAQIPRYDGAGDVALVGPDPLGVAGDGAVWVALVDGPVGGVPGQCPVGLVTGKGPARGVLEAVVGLAQGGEVVQAGGSALAPGGEVVDVAPAGGGLAGGEDAGPVAGRVPGRPGRPEDGSGCGPRS